MYQHLKCPNEVFGTYFIKIFLIGTREAKSSASTSNKEPWYKIIWGHCKDFCRMCCRYRFYQDEDRSRLMITESDLISEAGESISDESTRVSLSIYT